MCGGGDCRLRSGISGTVSCLFGKLFHPFFFYLLIDDHPSPIEAGIKIGSVTRKLITLVAEIDLFFLVTGAYPTVFKKLALFIAASVAVYRNSLIGK